MKTILRKPSEAQINPKSAWDNDPFDRQKDGETLCNLIASSTSDPLVISLQAPWGTGKSTFLRRLSAAMESTHLIPCITIDAWKNDNVENPLEAITSELVLKIDEKKERTKSEKIKEAAELCAINVFKAGLEVAKPVVALGAESLIPLGSAATNAALSKASEALENHRRARSAEPDFKNALTRARDLLSRRADGRPIKPILMIIDELDRCRPDYAIKTLEQIKHYFGVPGITFLVATDRGNLPSAVKTVYGQHVDGELYLRKFFDFEFHLPPPPPKKYAKHLIEKYILTNEEPNHNFKPANQLQANQTEILLRKEKINSTDKTEYLIHFADMADALELSLRDQSQALTMLAAYVHSRSANTVRLPIIDCFICCIRFGSPEAFREIVHSKSLSVITNNKDQLILSRLRNTRQWEIIDSFFRGNTPMQHMLSRGGTQDANPEPWEQMIHPVNNKYIEIDSALWRAVLGYRMKKGQVIAPYSYASEVIRLTPPLRDDVSRDDA